MEFAAAQQDMRQSFIGGSTGVLASGLVWCSGAIVGLFYSHWASMLTLFFGGMLIYPLSILFSKLFKRSGKPLPDNPLNRLGIESTFILFVGLFLAFYIATLQTLWFYPIMLQIIGVRYLMFTTLYGMTTYWVLGAVLMLAGATCMVLGAPFVVAAFIGGVTEMIFSLVIVYRVSRTMHSVD